MGWRWAHAKAAAVLRCASTSHQQVCILNLHSVVCQLKNGKCFSVWEDGPLVCVPDSAPNVPSAPLMVHPQHHYQPDQLPTSLPHVSPPHASSCCLEYKPCSVFQKEECGPCPFGRALWTSSARLTLVRRRAGPQWQSRLPSSEGPPCPGQAPASVSGRQGPSALRTLPMRL